MLISVQEAAGEDGRTGFACVNRYVNERKDNLASVRSRAVSELSHQANMILRFLSKGAFRSFPLIPPPC